MSGHKRGVAGVRLCWASGCRQSWPCKAHGFQAAYSGTPVGRTPNAHELVPGEHFWRCLACKFYACSCKPPEPQRPPQSGWFVADASVYQHATLKNEVGSPAIVLQARSHWETNSRKDSTIYATAEEAMRAAEKLFAPKPATDAPPGWHKVDFRSYRHESGARCHWQHDLLRWVATSVAGALTQHLTRPGAMAAALGAEASS